MAEPAGGSGSQRGGLLRPLLRLFLCGFYVALALGLHDALAGGPALYWYEQGDIVGIYALLGGAATLFALLPTALLLLLARRVVAPARVVPLLLWAALAILLFGLRELDAIGRPLAFAALALVTLLAVRAVRSGSFEEPRPWRWRSLIALLLGIGLCVVPASGRRAARPAPTNEKREGGRPDIVLVVLDTQRADYFGAYGHPGRLTPVFDRLATEGTLFTRCYASAPWTVPSHATLFTGLEPPTHGCSFEHHRHLDRKFTTLAEHLKAQAGYETAAFVANGYLFESNLLQGFDSVHAAGARSSRLALRPLLELLGWPERYADHGAADAIDELDRYLARPRDDDAPRLLFVNLMETHWRYLPVLADRWQATRPDPGVLPATDIACNFYGPLQMAGKKVPGATQAEVDDALRKLYAAAVRYQDRMLGLLLDLLARRLDLDRTLLVVTADHGENLGDGGRYDHVFALNEALLHVPLVIRHPPTFGAGAHIDGLCGLVDLAPTLAAIAQPQVPFGALGANGDESATLAGRSLLPTQFVPRDVLFAFGDPYLGHLEAMSLHTGFNRDVLPFAAVLRSASDGRHKLVRTLGIGERLFDLAADPAETRDVSAALPEVAAALRKRLDEALLALPAYVGPPLTAPEDPDPDLFDRARLSALGYINYKDK